MNKSIIVFTARFNFVQDGIHSFEVPLTPNQKVIDFRLPPVNPGEIYLYVYGPNEYEEHRIHQFYAIQSGDFRAVPDDCGDFVCAITEPYHKTLYHVFKRAS